MASLDYRIFSLINNLVGQSGIFDLLMIYMAKYGEYLYVIFLLFLWFKPGDKVRTRKLAIKAVVSTIFAVLINQGIGLVYFRPRPFASHQVNMLIAKSPDPSFPSDHATGSNALTWSIIGQEPVLGLTMLGTTILLMFSRIYVGTHYPLDVLGGALTGFIGSWLVNIVWGKMERLTDYLLKIYNRFIPI